MFQSRFSVCCKNSIVNMESGLSTIIFRSQCILFIIPYNVIKNNSWICIASLFSFVTCFVPWPTPRNRQWGSVKNETLRQRRWFQFSHCELFICSNIPAAPAYGVYISQMIRYSRAGGSYQDFLDRGLLSGKLLNQGFLLVKLKSSLRKFYGRHHHLIDRYGISVPQMTTNMFHLS
jgi:hypothetical protein